MTVIQYHESRLLMIYQKIHFLSLPQQRILHTLALDQQNLVSAEKLSDRNTSHKIHCRIFYSDAKIMEIKVKLSVWIKSK